MTEAPLSIVHLLLTRRFAGTERHVVELANAQAESGHRVTVILRQAGAEHRDDAIAHRFSDAVRVEVVGDLLSTWQARGLLARLQPDIAHAHLSGGCRALKGWRDARTRRIATLHIRYKPQQHEGLDGLIAIAPWQFGDVPADMRARSVQIDNWTVPREASADARERLRAEWSLAPDAFVFGALGRTEPGKGLDVLLEAWRIANLPEEARMVIVGQGTAWKSLRGAAPRSVVMPGFSLQSRDWLEAFDVFVSAARSEPFGLVLLEAMSARLPILASASEGASHLREIIERPLVPVGDADALAQALRLAYAQRPPRRDYPMQRFRIEDKLVEIESFYRSVIAHR